MFKNLFSSNSAPRNAPVQSGDDTTESLKVLVEGMVDALVDEPNEVALSIANQDEDLINFELRVSKADLGKVIGKKGRTASAMRTILSAASRKHRVNADLKIVE